MAAMTPEEYEAAVMKLDADADVIQSLRGRDPSGLTKALKGAEFMFCAIFAPDDEERDDEPSREEEEKPQDE